MKLAEGLEGLKDLSGGTKLILGSLLAVIAMEGAASLGGDPSQKTKIRNHPAEFLAPRPDVITGPTLIECSDEVYNNDLLVIYNYNTDQFTTVHNPDSIFCQGVKPVEFTPPENPWNDIS